MQFAVRHKNDAILCNLRVVLTSTDCAKAHAALQNVSYLAPSFVNHATFEKNYSSKVLLNEFDTNIMWSTLRKIIHRKYILFKKEWCAVVHY